ncbi:hypothetical protein WDW89_23825 [Deltaproteobacteria bacterium TL4]
MSKEPVHKVMSKAVKQMVSHRVHWELERGKRIAVQQMDKTLFRSGIDIFFNVIILLMAIFGAKYWFTKEQATLLVTLVYMGSALYGIIRILLNLGTIFSCLFFFLKYRHKAIHQWIKAKIAPEVHNAYNEMHLMGKFLIAFGMGPKQAEYIEMQSEYILKATVMRLFLWVGVLLVYVGVFRFIVAPTLIEDLTGLGLVQAFFWPFANSIDYYCGTDLSSFVQQADYLGAIKNLILCFKNQLVEWSSWIHQLRGQT